MPSSKKYVFAAAVIAWFVGMSTSVASADGELARPNILFILTDDQGWPTLGSYGNHVVPTPHLDRLAAEGMRFTDAYVMPQCTPTRAALMTGQHTARTGMWHVIAAPWYGYPWAPVAEPPFREALPPEWCVLPQAMKSAGYKTGMAGKWHLSNSDDGDYVALEAHAASRYGFDFVAPRGEGSPGEGDKWVDHLTDQAIGFITSHRKEPWFFYLSHHTLHGKVSAPEETIAAYRDAGFPAEGLYNATYLAAIEHLDASIGRLVTALDELGLSDSTMIVFLSDNGGVFEAYSSAPFVDGPGAVDRLDVGSREYPNTPLRAGKGSAYEGGIRVPCIVRWPEKVARRQVNDTPIHIVDWLPTLCEAAGTTVDSRWHQDGVSLMPLLTGLTLAERPLFWYLPLYDLRWGATPSAILRRGDWKLIEYFNGHFDRRGHYRPGPHVELFHLADDTTETYNVAINEPERVESMREELHRLIEDCGQMLPAANTHFDPTRPFKETKSKPDFLLKAHSGS